MKYLLTGFALALMAFSPSSDAVEWIDLETAQQRAKKDKKFILVDFYTPWCGPCKMMSARTLEDPTVAEYMTNHLHSVKFNAEGNDEVTLSGKKYVNQGFIKDRPATSRNNTHDLTRHFQVRGYPTILILKPDGTVKGKIVGYKGADQFMNELQRITGVQ